MEESKRRRPTDLGPSGERVGKNVAQVRSLRRLTTGALADRLAELGHPLQASAVTKIEKGSRRVDADDLVALALALGVTPNRLLLPDASMDTADQVELTSEVKAESLTAWRWACGETPLPSGKALSPQGIFEFHRQNRPHDPDALTPEQAFGLASAFSQKFEQLGRLADEMGIPLQTAVTLFQAWAEWRPKPGEQQPTPSSLGLPQGRTSPANTNG